MKAIIVVVLFGIAAVLAACDSTPVATPTPRPSSIEELEATVVALQTEVSLRGTMSALQTQLVQPNASSATAATQPPGATAVAVGTQPTQRPVATLPATPANNPTAPPLAAGTFYVATTGSDSAGDGSIEKPWATISGALASVSDGSTILVRPGVYSGRIRLRSFRPEVTFTQVTVRSETPYAAQLRASDDTVITCYEECHGITLEGFDIAHTEPGTPSRVIVVHIDGQGDRQASGITLRNNIIHDSYNNDILKINNNATNIMVEGNIFYNQQGSDEHIDINSVISVTVQDNIFFNDFAGSGRTDTKETSSYIVIKDSNGDEDGVTGSDNITVRRNIFANWEGGEGAYFVLVGEDGMPYHEARNVMVENNLMLGNSRNIIRATFGVKGGRDVTFRNNTVAGDLPSRAYGMRLNVEGDNPPNENIRFFNNVWSDPIGTMGSRGPDSISRFAEVPSGETDSFTLSNNLYWNGGRPIPTSEEDDINYTDDTRQKMGDPLLGKQDGMVLPRWDGGAGRFAEQSTTVREAFERMVELYGRPVAGSPVIDAADPAQTPAEDILGAQRSEGGNPDLGALESKP